MLLPSLLLFSLAEKSDENQEEDGGGEDGDEDGGEDGGDKEEDKEEASTLSASAASTRSAASSTLVSPKHSQRARQVPESGGTPAEIIARRTCFEFWLFQRFIF